MRKLIGLGLLAALAWPAVAFADTPCERAEGLLSDVQTERFRLEGESEKAARKAARFLKKGEKALGKLIGRFQADPALEHKKMALFAKAGQWIERARATGATADDAAPVTGWAAWYASCMADVDELVDDATSECDRLISDSLRSRVSRRLEKGLAFYDSATAEGDALVRARLMVRAVQHVVGALQKAEKYCLKESKPSCPSGIVAENYRLTYRGRRVLTVFDVEWHLTLRTREGAVVGQRDDHLARPGGRPDTPLPWQIEQGTTLDGLDIANVALGFGHRIDGVLIWRTSAGEIEVPVHVDQ